MTSYREILEHRHNSGIRLGLGRMFALMEQLGNPQNQIPTIHVAGTNGKGSVCAFVERMLREAGYRVGRYSSPHLIDWRERITVQGQPISEADFDRVLALLEPHLALLPEVTQFETLTAAAFWYAAEQKLDFLVLEVGLGGRLDATNVVKQPLVTAITSIGLDHCNILGDSLGAIAHEKAGIFKSGVPIVTAALPEEAQVRMSTLAQSKGCRVRVMAPATVQASGYQALGITYQPRLGGAIQAQNSSVALGIVDELIAQGWRIPVAAQQRGLALAQWPGRYQTLTYGTQKLLIDGAHNLDGAAALRHYVDGWGRPVSWLVGIIKTKNPQEILGCLLRPDDELFTLPVQGDLGHDPEGLVQLAYQLEPALAQGLACAQVKTALACAGYPPVLCGSLYLIGDFLKDLGYSPEQLSS